MIKTGLYKLSQLENKNTTFFRKELKNVSITLYDQILNETQSEALAERILLLFSDERGAYKRMYQKRFETFDTQILQVLHSIFFSSNTLSFHDVGVSDGRTALDFFEKLSLVFPETSYLASDYNPSVYVIEKGKLKVTLSRTGKILEILFPPFVFNKIKRDSLRHYPLNHCIRLCVEKFFVTSLLRQYQKGYVKAKQLLLFSPNVLAYAQKDGRFTLGQHDLLKPFRQPVDVIRAMNVLNLSYFCELEFKKVIHNLYQGLKDNGVLITGSNQEAGTLVHGAIYKKCAHGFERIFQSGDGSQVHSMILDFRTTVS